MVVAEKRTAIAIGDWVDWRDTEIVDFPKPGQPARSYEEMLPFVSSIGRGDALLGAMVNPIRAEMHLPHELPLTTNPTTNTYGQGNR